MTENRSGNSPFPVQTNERTLANRMQLAVSRICHDLVSPLGAIANGIELLLLSGQAGTAELDLVEASSAAALARLRLFRIAFGMAEPDKAVSSKEIKSMFATLSQNGRVKIDWQANHQVPSVQLQAICLAMQCIENALPYGGEAKISYEKDRWHIHAHASRIKADEAIWGPISRGEAPSNITAALLQFALLPEALSALARPAKIVLSEQSIQITF